MSTRQIKKPGYLHYMAFINSLREKEVFKKNNSKKIHKYLCKWKTL